MPLSQVLKAKIDKTFDEIIQMDSAQYKFGPESTTANEVGNVVHVLTKNVKKPDELSLSDQD